MPAPLHPSAMRSERQARHPDMSEISERYARRASAFAEKVAAVSEDQWAAPSPCEDWTARDVVGHVVQSQGMFLGFVGREMGEHPSVDDDPEGAVRAVTGRIQQDLEDPELAAQTFEGFMGTQAFEASVDQFLAADLLIHGWDLACLLYTSPSPRDRTRTRMQSSA